MKILLFVLLCIVLGLFCVGFSWCAYDATNEYTQYIPARLMLYAFFLAALCVVLWIVYICFYS